MKISEYKWYELKNLFSKYIYKPIDWHYRFNDILCNILIKSKFFNDDYKNNTIKSIYNEAIEDNLFEYYDNEKEAIKISCEELLRLSKQLQEIAEKKLKELKN